MFECDIIYLSLCIFLYRTCGIFVRNCSANTMTILNFNGPGNSPWERIVFVCVHNSKFNQIWMGLKYVWRNRYLMYHRSVHFVVEIFVEILWHFIQIKSNSKQSYESLFLRAIHFPRISSSASEYKYNSFH